MDRYKGVIVSKQYTVSIFQLWLCFLQQITLNTPFDEILITNSFALFHQH